VQELTERGDIQSMMSRGEYRQVLFRELKQTHGWRQASAVFRVQWMFEPLLQMNEGARCLDQPFEEIRVARIRFFQPKLLENIVRFIITLLVPAVKKRAIKGVLCDVCLGEIDIFTVQLGHQLRNPLAFVHEGLNLLAAQIMSKPARISFSEEQGRPPEADEFSQPAWLCHHRR